VGGIVTTIAGRALASGDASGSALVLSEPLGFWGGLDPTTGRLTDPHHPQIGAIVTGRVLVMPAGRGSSSSSSVLAEAIRLDTAPAAIVLGEPDPILAIGAIVGRELYGAGVPVVTIGVDALGRTEEGRSVRITGSVLTVAP
jgi:predicted aconitase with swiveling domain